MGSLFLARIYAFGIIAASSLVLADNKSINVTMSFAPPASSAGNVVYDDFLGISFELASFDTLWGKTPSTIPNAMLNYLANIKARIQNPLRIRIGGNSMDAATYQSSQSSMIVMTDPNAYFNDIPVDFGPVFWKVLNTVADKVGEMKFMVGLTMQDPAEDSNLIEIAAAAEQELGDRLDALVLGNEPDLYANHGKRTSYKISDYIPEIGNVIQDLSNATSGNLLSTKLLAGPGTCCNWDLDEVIEGGLDQYPYKYYTIQHYPDNSCNGINAENTNISFFLSHANVAPYTHFNQAGVDMAKKDGVQVLVTEYNSISCGGTNISDTFATAMWAVDAGLNFASANITAAYLHTREFNVSYNLFDAPDGKPITESGWRTGSPYYSALVLAEAMSPTGSVVVDLNIDNSIQSPSSTVAGYGIYDNGGTTRGKLVLFNYHNDESQTFVIPANTTMAAGVRLLLAPDVAERNDISWAGQSVGQNGDLEGNQTTHLIHCRDGCTIEVPGPGVALVLFDPRSPYTDSFFHGNSTIAGLSGYWSGAPAVKASWLLQGMSTMVGLIILSWLY